MWLLHRSICSSGAFLLIIETHFLQFIYHPNQLVNSLLSLDVLLLHNMSTLVSYASTVQHKSYFTFHIHYVHHRGFKQVPFYTWSKQTIMIYLKQMATQRVVAYRLQAHKDSWSGIQGLVQCTDSVTAVISLHYNKLD